jgi:hypothetical protein
MKLPPVKPVPPAFTSAFDKQVDAKLEGTVKTVRDNAAREALEFLTAEPLDPARPLKGRSKPKA